ncbi:MAG: hypothetical protein QXP34_00465 [Candidatus Aenigmatarchaeota archaeon]
MYIIGITPGTYTIARGGGAEAAREFAGIVEKISYGYTVGCNFFQIDQESFGEFIEPEMIRKLAYLVEKMNVEWALHGLLFGSELYQTLEHINFAEWKRTHLILNKDLILLYYILTQIKKHKYSPKVFPHYTVYHASLEFMVGYAHIGEIMALKEVITATPFGKVSWIDFLEKREELKKWFIESGLIEVIISREFARVRRLERVFSKDFVEKVFRIINFFVEDYEKDTKKNIWDSLEDNKRREIIGEFLERLIRLPLLPEHLRFEQISNILKSLKDEINKNPLVILELEDLAKSYDTEISKRYLRDKFGEQGKNIYEKYFGEIKTVSKETIDTVFKIWIEISKLGRIAGGIFYEDVVMALIAKYVELIADEKMRANEDDIPYEICKFLRERYLTKNGKFFGEKVSLEEHVKFVYNNQKELIDRDRLIINLTPQVNVLVSIVYWVGHYLVGIEDFPEILDHIKSLPERDENIINEIISFAKLKPIEKLKKINEELKNLGVKREVPFFMAVENPEGSTPHEGLRRICHLIDVFITSEALNLLYRKYSSEKYAFFTCIDTEHLLSNAFDPEKEIRNLIEYIRSAREVYSRVAVYHIGVPKPYYGTTHIPFDVGSEEQFLIYKYCYFLKEAGFDEKHNSYLIFERGGGQLPYQFLRTVVLALRLIVKYLEMNVSPEDLIKKEEYAKDFFGISEQELREREIIFQHALEPLRGMIVWPEEYHTLFGKEAIERYRKRPEEWAAEELK